MKWTNKYNLPERVIRQISNVHKPNPERISITHLIDCPRERQLMIDHWDNLELDYSDFLQTLLGISVHARQDSLAKGTDVESEIKFEDKVGLFIVVGKADNYDSKDAVVRETKVKAVGVLEYESFIVEVTKQLNCYAWQLRKRNFPVKKLELDVYYRDWVQWQARKANTTSYAVMKKGRKTAVKTFSSLDEAIKYEDKLFSSSSCNEDDHYYVETREASGLYPVLPIDHSIPINLWTFKEQEEFVHDQVELFTLDPYYCGPEGRWKNDLRCKEYCKARTVCEYAKSLKGKTNEEK